MQDEKNKAQEYFRQLKSDYEIVFSTSEGKRVLEDIANSGHIYKSHFTPSDPYTTARNEGMRTLALHITSMSKKDKEIEESKKKAIT